jgi:hypothetical protein
MRLALKSRGWETLGLTCCLWPERSLRAADPFKQAAGVSRVTGCSLSTAAWVHWFMSGCWAQVVLPEGAYDISVELPAEFDVEQSFDTKCACQADL